jgi:hypothetical protein
MNFDLNNENEAKIASDMFNKLLLDGRLIELKQIKKTRTNLQNRALHLFLTMISDNLNELGLEFLYTGIKGSQMSIRYTPEVVKQFIWKPIQMTLFKEKSTTKLNTLQLNEISDILIKFFGERDISLSFPNFKDLIEPKEI